MSILEQLAATEIGDLMHGSPVSVTPQEPLEAVVDAMRDRFGAMLITEDDRLVGIFTERDLMLRVDHENTSWHETPVRDVMTPTPATLAPTSTLAEAITLMSQGRFRHVPVVDGQRLVGIVSIRDVMTYAVEHYPKNFVNLPPGPQSEASGPWGG
jgi:CBS domain-containing protein